MVSDTVKIGLDDETVVKKIRTKGIGANSEKQDSNGNGKDTVEAPTKIQNIHNRHFKIYTRAEIMYRCEGITNTEEKALRKKRGRWE